MAEKRGKKVAAIAGAAVIAAGGGAAKLAAMGGDDAARMGPKVAPHVDDYRPGGGLPKPPRNPEPPSGSVSEGGSALGASDDLEAALSDPMTQDAACAALSFLDTTSADAGFEEYASWAYYEVSPLPRDRAVQIFQAASDVYYNGDPSAYMDLYCSVR